MKSTLPIVLLLVACSVIGRAETRVVPDAYQTIQAAIDAAADGDVVLLKDGIYAGDGNRNVDFKGRKITLRSEHGHGGCVLDCQGLGRAFVFQNGEGPSSVLDGITIVGGFTDDSGGAILCSRSSPTISNLVIIGNRARQSGGGIAAISGSPRINNTALLGNIAAAGGGISFRGGDPAVVNCTLNANTSGNGAAIYCDNGSLTLCNSILWGDKAQSQLSMGPAATVSITCCTIQGGPAGVRGGEKGGLFWGQGTIVADPLFVLPGDYHLQADSLSIDGGTNSPPGDVPPRDLDGGPRSQDGDGDTVPRIDIGASERSRSDPILGVAPARIEFFGKEGGPNPYGEALSIVNVGGGSLQWEAVEDCPWLQVIPSSGRSVGQTMLVAVKTDTKGLTHGHYSYLLRVKAEGASNSPSCVVVVVNVNAELNVPRDYPTIQAGIDAAMTGDTVLVDDGVYTGPGNRDITFRGKSITVRSANGPWKCIIDCELAGRGFHFRQGERPEAVLEGFAIRNGYVPASWPQLSLGGGIVCEASSPTIRRNIITGNRGCGIYCRGAASPAIRNNFIIHNVADWGGCGIYCEAGSAAEIVNNTIVGNPGGGIRAWGSSATVVNCILWNNGEECGGGVPTFCCIQDGTKAVGNKFSYPHFIDPLHGDYRIRSYSPCIDAGNETVVTVDDRDIDGHPRSSLLRVDIGAHEPGEKSPDSENQRLGDDLPDAWEKQHFKSIAGSKWDDPDFDELTNYEEFRSGTDPNYDQRIVCVSAANANDPQADGTARHPFPTIRQGVAVASRKVLVARGRYVEQIAVCGKSIDIEGGYDSGFLRRDPGQYPTIIDAGGVYRAVTFVNTQGGSLSGFIITGGNAYQGGGVCATLASPTIEGNVFINNAANCGGAIECGWRSASIIRNNVFIGNGARYAGGAIYLWAEAAAAISGNVIIGNAARVGGAVYCSGRSTAAVIGCLVQDNSLVASPADLPAGEIALWQDSRLTVIDSAVAGGAGGVDVPFGCTLTWGSGNILP
ncbi:MAG TPA: right-handed parallel beta-helix repeat-containing protein [Planctomycetota bacterium]|nr:right-handed parallel beta-helix repeat-containing protein [Planctomycetota bacterium]